ncbi:DEAD protein, partial [Rhizoctonia solani]
MEAISLPSKVTPRMLKRKHSAVTSASRKKNKLGSAHEDVSNYGSDTEDDGLAWRPVSRPAGAMLGGGLDEDGGLLTIEEIEDVDVEYVDTEAGGRIAKLKKRGRSSGKRQTNGSTKPSNTIPISTNVTFDQSLLPEWASMSLHPIISHSLLALSFTNPTPIQKSALPFAQQGRDVVGVAETGSGKTLAYSLPILQYILSNPTSNSSRKLAALILAPTRELALQVCEHLKKVISAGASSSNGGVPRVSIAAIVGGLSVQKQRRILERGADIIVATPGRLWDVLGENNTLARQIRSVQFLVLDEADRMVEAGHFQELDNIVKLTVRRKEPEEQDEMAGDPVFAEATAAAVDSAPANTEMQTFVFSATMSKELQINLSRRSTKRKNKDQKGSTLDDLLMKLDFRDPNPAIVDLSPEYGKVSTLTESRIECVSGDKDFYLYYFLLRYPGRSLVFVSSIDGIRRLTPIMEQLQLKVFPLHSQLQQRQRLKNLDRFKSTPSAVLIATDVAARGLDIPSVDHVIHYQLPRTADAYVHRNGRTARAQREGFSLLLIAPNERGIMKGLMESLKRAEPIVELPIEHDILDRLKHRVQLARQIDAAQHKVKKDNHEKNWLKETAEALEIELDSDIEAHNEKSHQAKKNFAKVQKLKLELKELLSEPLVAKGISRRYITSGSRSIADDLVNARNHKKMLGVPNVSAGEDVAIQVPYPLPPPPSLPFTSCTFYLLHLTMATTETLDDGRVKSRVANYTAFWDNDSAKDGDAHKDNRLENYKDVINGYYDGATELYEYGWAQSFHFSRFYRGEAFLQSLARHEHYLASMMNLKPGMRVLDVGCGVGGPAREIARFADVNITGLNNNDFQIGRARKYTEKAGLSDQVQFVKGDFMKLSEQFGENNFDAVYAIEATVHAPTWEGVYGEIKKVLKPGGIFGVYEWCMTDAWDPSNPEHKDIAHGIEVGDGIPEMRTIKQAREALKTVGFEILHEEDLADRPDPIPWYYPLEGDIWKAQTAWDYITVWRMSWSGKIVTQTTVRVLEAFGLVPKGTFDVGEALKKAADALVRGGQQKLFTPMYLVVSRKPEATMEENMSMNHVLSAHLLDSFDHSRRASAPPFGGHGQAGHGSSTQLGFFPMTHGSYSQMSMMSNNSLSVEQLAQMQAKLNKKLGPEFISQRPGPKLTYAEGWKIINLANEVFGFNGWSSSVLSITTDYVRSVFSQLIACIRAYLHLFTTQIDQNPETHRYNVGVSALVRVTLRDGAFHEDVGFGALENSRGKGAALDKCKKEAVTDAIKRTLRNFGNVLGNCLYDKQYVSEIAKVKAPVVKLDQESLHRRPDLAGPVPNMPPPRESTPQSTTSFARNLPPRSLGNPSPLATSTPVTNRTLGNELPTPDTSLVGPPAIAQSAQPAQPAPQTKVSRNINPQPPRSASPITRPTHPPNTDNSNTRVTPPVSEVNPEDPAPPAPVEPTSGQALFDIRLVGELPEDGSVYGGSEDDAFFDNILPGELDMEVPDVAPVPPRSAGPQISKPDSRASPTAREEPGSTSDSVSSPPGATSNGILEESVTKRPRIRLADAIRGGAPGTGGSGPGVGQKRQRTN